MRSKATLSIFFAYFAKLRCLRLRSFKGPNRKGFTEVAKQIALIVVLTFGVGKSWSAPSKPRPNVILITIDTVRADHVGCYDAKNVETPTLDSLSRDVIVFERAISQVPLTWPSHTEILTGTYSFQHGVEGFPGTQPAP